MDDQVDLFYNTYANFNEQVLAAVREETFGHDIGQNSWLTAEEYERFIGWLGVGEGSNVLEVASGSGGPALHLAASTGCRVTGVDVNAYGVATARRAAIAAGLTHLLKFKVADATDALPFVDQYLEGGLALLESGGSREEAMKSFRKGIKFAQLADQAAPGAAFAEYATNFASWTPAEQQRFREGQAAYKAGRGLAKDDSAQAYDQFRKALSIANALGDPAAYDRATKELARNSN